jgi:hypothetical protein
LTIPAGLREGASQSRRGTESVLYICHQTAGIDIASPVFNGALAEALRAANVSSFQSLAAIPQYI